MKDDELKRALAYIKDWLRFKYEREEVPGIVVAVSYKGKVLLNEAYGYANLETKEKMTTDHIFRIASHSKTFAATAVMQLQENGKLKIDDYAVKYLSWLKDHEDKRWQKVTIRQLLSHGAGVIRDGLNQGYWSLEKPFPDEGELKKEILRTDLIIDNNTALKYSNYGYSLIGMIIEAASGQKFATYTVENIIKPLGLKSTGPEYKDIIKDRLVTGYSSLDDKKKRLPIANIDTHAMVAATGFYSTSAELCKYFSAHVLGSGLLLDDESKKEMQKSQWQVKHQAEKEEYALGLDIEYIKGKRTFGHGGGFPGQITKTICYPDQELVITVLTNSLDGEAGNKAKSIFKAIDFFQKGSQKTVADNLKYEGRFMTLWYAVDFVAKGKKMYCASPNSWHPFYYADEIEKIGQDTFNIIKSNSYGHEGELVKFTLDSSSAVKEVNFAGSKLLPEAQYLKFLKSRKMIG